MADVEDMMSRSKMVFDAYMTELSKKLDAFGWLLTGVKVVPSDDEDTAYWKISIAGKLGNTDAIIVILPKVSQIAMSAAQSSPEAAANLAGVLTRTAMAVAAGSQIALDKMDDIESAAQEIIRESGGDKSH